MTRTLAAALFLAGCATSHSYEDLGRACIGEPKAPWGLEDTAEPLIIADGDTVPVVAVLSDCSSGSTDWLNQVCEATVKGDRIEVTSSGKTKTPRSQTDDCQWITQDCGTVTLTGGDWTLAYGTGEVSFAVPYDGATICAENPI